MKRKNLMTVVTTKNEPKKKCYVFLAAMLLAVAALHAQSEKRVLFVGNSYTAVNDLPSMVNDVAGSLGERIACQSYTPGGCTFMQHCQNQSMTLIRQGGWDAVILQEQSQYPAFPDAQVQSEVFPYAQQLVDSIYAASPCAEPMFYMTWGRKYGDQTNGVIFPPIGSYEGMDSLLALRYRMMADQNDASLCPVGRVWHYLRDNNPEIELYQSDDSHPSIAGTYAAACAFCTMLFGRNPEEIAFDATLEPDVASTIRMAVRAVVFDSLPRWQRPLPQAEIVCADTAGYMEPTFALSTAHADSAYIDWGDGSDTLLAASAQQFISHRYAHEGEYEIRVRATRHCLTTGSSLAYTARQEPDVPEGIAAPGITHVTVLPNPAKQWVEIAANQQIDAVELIDLKGRLLKRYHPKASSACLRLPSLPSGAYLLRACTPSGPHTMRLMIN